MVSNVTAKWIYQMLENESLWQLAQRVHGLFTRGKIDFAIVGGVVVCLHGYRRNTVDLDVLIRPEQASESRAALESDGLAWNAESKELRTPSGIAVQFVMAGESEGPGQSARFPDPADASCLTHIEGLPVLSLAAL